MQDDKIELRYYSIPKGEYLVSKLGKGWEQEYAKGMGRQLHFHNVYEIGYCYHGKGEALIDDRSYFYGDNCYTFVPANITHTTISEPGNICKWEWLFIDLEGFIRDAARLDDMSKEEIIRIISRRGTMKSRKNHPVMANIVLNLIRESRAKERLYKASIQAYLSALVIELLRLDEERQYSERAGRVSRYIQSAIDYVHFHYTEEIKVSKMALVCGLSESHFRRIFDESVGMTPMDYINIVRIEKACSLLSGTEQSVKEICFAVGYDTPSTFNRNFMKVTGKTPSQWKKEHKNEGVDLSDYHVNIKKGWEAPGEQKDTPELFLLKGENVLDK